MTSLGVALSGYLLMGHVCIYDDNWKRNVEIRAGQRESSHRCKGVNLFHVVGRLLEIVQNLILEGSNCPRGMLLT